MILQLWDTAESRNSQCLDVPPMSLHDPHNRKTIDQGEGIAVALLPVELGLLITFVFLIITYARTAVSLNRIMWKLEHAPYEPIDLSQEFPAPFYRSPKEAKELVLDAEFVEKKDSSKFVSIDGKPLFLLKAGVEASTDDEEEEEFRPQLPPYLEHEKRASKRIRARLDEADEDEGPSRGPKRRGRAESEQDRRRRSGPAKRKRTKGRRSGARGRKRKREPEYSEDEYEDDRYDD